MNPIKNPFYNPLIPEEGVISLVKEWSEREKKGDRNARQDAVFKIEKYLMKTADGSYTLQSDVRDKSSETMHTRHGAFYEANEKFVNPSGIENKEKIAILDICSGLGINASAALENLLYSESDVKLEMIEIDMVEISWETLAASLIIPSPSESHLLVKKAIENYLIKQGMLQFPKEEKEIPDHVNIRVYCKDAREMVTEIPKTRRYDAVFLDPFSPAKSPELYSYEFLSEISSLLKADGVILTYTSAAPVRYAIMDMGLEVGEGPEIGRSGGTIASYDLNKIPHDLSENDERMIALSDAGIPYRDPELNLSAEKIIENRQVERITIRGVTKMASTVKTPVKLVTDLDDERQKRRVLKHLKKFGIDDLNSLKSRFLVCPQFSNCICNCGHGRPSTSRARIKEMEKRLEIITNGNFKNDRLNNH